MVGKDLPKSQVFSSEWKTERVREDESGDSKDGEDELPCVIGGERDGDDLTMAHSHSKLVVIQLLHG